MNSLRNASSAPRDFPGHQRKIVILLMFDLVELVGLEPTTSSLRTMASSNFSRFLACT